MMHRWNLASRKQFLRINDSTDPCISKVLDQNEKLLQQSSIMGLYLAECVAAEPLNISRFNLKNERQCAQ